MKNKDYFFVSLQVVLIFLVLIVASFIPDQFPDFFGDQNCDGYILERGWKEVNGKLDYVVLRKAGTCTVFFSQHGPGSHWGYRHFLFFLMGLTLVVLQILRLVKTYSKNSE
jgi:hypothetical protein